MLHGVVCWCYMRCTKIKGIILYLGIVLEACSKDCMRQILDHGKQAHYILKEYAGGCCDLAKRCAIALKAPAMGLLASATVAEAAPVLPNLVTGCPGGPSYPAKPVALAGDLRAADMSGMGESCKLTHASSLQQFIQPSGRIRAGGPAATDQPVQQLSQISSFSHLHGQVPLTPCLSIRLTINGVLKTNKAIWDPHQPHSTISQRKRPLWLALLPTLSQLPDSATLHGHRRAGAH